MSDYPKEYLDLLNSVVAKRPRTVIQHILAHGSITSQDLKDQYGYNHPPRAIRDVREYGIPIVTERAEGTDGRQIAVYRLGEPSNCTWNTSKAAGRTILSKALKKALIDRYGARCFIYLERLDPALLQVDHRIPYEIGGATDNSSIDDYMLLSASANRAKSWTCEHCTNWSERNASFCADCFWAHPERYQHVAGRPERRIELVFTGDEVRDYDRLIQLAGPGKEQDTVKQLIKDYLR